MNRRNAATCKTASGLRFPPTNLIRVAQQFHFHALIVLPFVSGTRKSGGTVRAGRAFGRMQQMGALGYARRKLAPEGPGETIRSTVLTVADGVRSNEGICHRGRRRGEEAVRVPRIPQGGCVCGRLARAVHTAPSPFATVHCWEPTRESLSLIQVPFSSIRARGPSPAVSLDCPEGANDKAL